MLGNNYEAFKEQIYRMTKIDLSAYKEKQMKRRIDSLIAKHHITTYTDYVMRLRTDKEMYDEFVNYLTINVSEFYRNPEQWKQLEEEILPYLRQNNPSGLKVWSAACSTGDEPYSLVMLLGKFMPLSRIRILATDLDKQVLEKAKVGLYDTASLKALPPDFKKRYFREIKQNTYQISEEVKRCVEFKQHNLLLDPYPTQWDLIVCRNVVIYFTEEAKTEIYKKFHAAMKANGILFVGSTEQMIAPAAIGFATFKSFFYKKI